MMLKTEVIGHIGQDCAVKHLDDGHVAINFSVASTERWKGRDGNKNESTTWVECTIWRNSADKAGIAEYLKKGMLVYVMGKPKPRSFISKNNEAIAVLGLKVDVIKLLGNSYSKTQNQKPTTDSVDTVDSESEDDLPF